MRDKIKFIKELAESMNANKIDTVKYEENDFEIQITKKEKERKSSLILSFQFLSYSISHRFNKYNKFAKKKK